MTTTDTHLAAWEARPEVDIAADVAEERVAYAIREAWETQGEFRPPWIVLARAALAAMPEASR